jgi:hypothetical protein
MPLDLREAGMQRRDVHLGWVLFQPVEERAQSGR